MSAEVNLLHDIEDYVERVNIDESLSSMLRAIIRKQVVDRPSPKNYFFVTHITNPAQAYWSILNPDLKKPKPLARKLATGKLLQTFANIWMRTLPEFIVEEGTLDGVWVGMPGVRGSIDYCVGEAIIEFKV